MKKLNETEEVFMYMLLYLVERYVKDHHPQKEFENLNEIFNLFNESNDFSQQKCELFPFLFTVGSKDKIATLKIFAPFVICSDSEKGAGLKSLELFFFFDRQTVISFEKYTTKRDKMVIDLNHEFIKKVGFLKSMENVAAPDEILDSFRLIIQNIKDVYVFKLKNVASLPIELISFWNRKNGVFRFHYSYFDTQGFLITDLQGKAKEVLDMINWNIAAEIFDLQCGPQNNTRVDFKPIEEKIYSFLNGVHWYQ